MSIPPLSPITPKEAKRRKGVTVPVVVIEIFNEFLAERYSPLITITQNEVVAQIIKRKNMQAQERQSIFERNWLDIEDLYTQHGWEVNFEKQVMADHIQEAYWTFSPQ